MHEKSHLFFKKNSTRNIKQQQQQGQEQTPPGEGEGGTEGHEHECECEHYQQQQRQAEGEEFVCEEELETDFEATRLRMTGE